MGINTPLKLVHADDTLVDALVYNDNGTDKDLHTFEKQQITNLRDFLQDRSRHKYKPFDPSKFVKLDVTSFITARTANVQSNADVLDVKQEGYYPNAAKDAECALQIHK